LSNVRRYLTEFIGTFFLVFTVVCTVQAGAALAPLAIGLVLAAMVFAGGHLSGAHYNPAVTLAVLVRGRVSVPDAGAYVVAQLLAAVAAAGCGRLVLGERPDHTFTADRTGGAFVAELLVTFALAYVVLNVATSRDHPNNSFYGLAIGATVLAGAVAVGPVSGGVFNPAVAVGVSTAGLVSWSMLWVYLVANLAAGALAGMAFRLLNPADLAPAGEAVTVEPVPGPAPVTAR
jgi:aquaporin Z